MNARAIALVAGGLAALLYGGVARPARQVADAAHEERARLEARRGSVAAELDGLRRRWGMTAAATKEAAVAALRRDVVEDLADFDVGGAILEVREGRDAIAAELHVRVTGATGEALLFAERLTDGRGVVLAQVRLVPARDGALNVDLQGFRLGGGS